MLTGRCQEMFQALLDCLVGDIVELKMHDGPPGRNCRDNLVLGDGLPQTYSFSLGGTVRFTIPELPERIARVPLPRRWWQFRTRYREERQPATLQVCDVSMWSDGLPVMLLAWRTPRPVRLREGDSLTLLDIQRPKAK